MLLDQAHLDADLGRGVAGIRLLRAGPSPRAGSLALLNPADHATSTLLRKRQVGGWQQARLNFRFGCILGWGVQATGSLYTSLAHQSFGLRQAP